YSSVTLPPQAPLTSRILGSPMRSPPWPQGHGSAAATMAFWSRRTGPAAAAVLAASVPAQFGAGQGVFVDLVRPVSEAQGADARVGRRQRKVLRQAGGAVDLDGLVEDPLHGLRGGDLDRLDLGVRGPRALDVHQPRCLQHQQAQLLDPDPGLRDPLPDHALV